ncbi:MAG: phosphatidylinositol-specific phospholipase C domain-containing protein, partial [Actinomycetota bacterium]
MRGPSVLLVVVVLLNLGPTARAQDLTDVADACHEAGADPGSCRGIEHFAHTLGVICRDASAGDPTCTSVDGTEISAARVAAHERSWLARVLRLQRGLDDAIPLQEELWTHTHNSYNADVYGPTIYGLDRNQIYSITDQLRMGIRAIEIDLHWAHSASGDPAQGGKAVVVCHGSQVPLEATNVHAGCGLNDPPLAARLQEVKDWLGRNRNEVVMLYLENQLEDNQVAHARAARDIEKILGPLVYKTSRSGGRCATLPYAKSRRQIRATGARVIVTGNCGPGAWGDWVHERGAQ